MRWCLCLLLCFGGLLLVWSPFAQAGADPGRESLWVGAKRCGSCHEKELKAWRAGPHSKAAQSLKARAGDGRCEGCHGTGDAPAGRSTLKNVQCEACHGAGLHYSSEDVMRDSVLAEALGLRPLASASQRAELCLRCHVESTSILPFEVEKAWLSILH